jgi:hypothetical protein
MTPNLVLASVLTRISQLLVSLKGRGYMRSVFLIRVLACHLEFILMGLLTVNPQYNFELCIIHVIKIAKDND